MFIKDSFMVSQSVTQLEKSFDMLSSSWTKGAPIKLAKKLEIITSTTSDCHDEPNPMPVYTEQSEVKKCFLSLGSQGTDASIRLRVLPFDFSVNLTAQLLLP